MALTEINGTTYHDSTPEAVTRALEFARQSRTRVRVWYGDADTGRAWPEENDVLGYIGRFTGTRKIPLLVHNARATGGGGLLDHCIVRIDTTSGNTLYQHPAFHAGHWEPLPTRHKRFNAEVRHNGIPHARFDSMRQAERYAAFMQGQRYAK